LIDNSIYWLETSYQDSKEILVKVIKTEKSIDIVVADNGPGFKDDITDLIRPFFSRKLDGIGIGLYLVDTIMLKYGKFEIIQPEDIESLQLPSKFSGAILKLIFNKL